MRRSRGRDLAACVVAATLGAPAVVTIGWTHPAAAAVPEDPPEAANSAPAATNDIAGTDIDTPVTIDVLANDVDQDGDALEILRHAVTSPFGGAVTVGASGGLDYTPAPDFEGVDLFTYDVGDGRGGTGTAEVRVYVGLTPLPPSPITVTPSPLAFVDVPHGRVADASITLTNNSAEALGPFTFLDDQADPAPFDTNVGYSPCTSVPLSPGSSCTHPVRFWSVPGAEAASPVTVLIWDSGRQVGVEHILLTGSTAPPVPPDSPNSSPDAVDDIGFIAADVTRLPLRLLVNDSDPDSDAMTITSTSDPNNGTIESILSCGDLQASSIASRHETCVLYTPAPGFRGFDQFDYTVDDGRGGTDTATYHMAVGSDPEIVIDSVEPSTGPPEGGQRVTIRGPYFLPGASAQFICDGAVHPAPTLARSTTEIMALTPPLPPGVCDVRVVAFHLRGTRVGGYTVVTTGPNRPPVANDDAVTVRQTQTVPIPVLANDTDPDGGDVIQVVGDTQPTHGQVDATAPDVYDYTPDPAYVGRDSFTYTIADQHGATATATVHIDVTPAVASVRANVTFEDAGLALDEQACFDLLGPSGRVGAVQCVHAASTGVTFPDVPLGAYSVAVAYFPAPEPGVPAPRLPARYALPGPGAVALTDDGSTAVVDIHVGLRSLIVRSPAAGACFEVAAAGLPTVSRCDGADGADDGVIRFVGLEGDEYTLRQTTVPAQTVRVRAQVVSVPGEVDVTAVPCTSCVSIKVVGPQHGSIDDACLAIPEGTWWEASEEFLAEDLALGCQDVDGVVSFGLFDPDYQCRDILGVIICSPMFGFGQTLPVVARRQGIVVANTTFDVTHDDAIQEIVVADPGRLVVHAVGEDGLPFPAPFDCGAPAGFARSDCVFEGVVGVTIGVGLPAAPGYVAPDSFGWTLTSMHDERTVRWPRVQVAVNRVDQDGSSSTGRFCVAISDLVGIASVFGCAQPRTDGFGHPMPTTLVLKLPTASTWLIDELESPPGQVPAASVTRTFGNGEHANVELRAGSATLSVLGVPPGHADVCVEVRAPGAVTALVRSCQNDPVAGFSLGPVVPGSYELHVVGLPAWYQPVVVPVGLVAGSNSVTVSVPDQPGLAVRLMEVDGWTEYETPVPGACWQVSDDPQGHGDVDMRRCDAADGAADGVTTFPGLPDGLYVLRQTTVPAGTVRIPTQFVTSRGLVSFEAVPCQLCVTAFLRTPGDNQPFAYDACATPTADELKFLDEWGDPYYEPRTLARRCADLDGAIHFGFYAVDGDVSLALHRAGIAVGTQNFTLGASGVGELQVIVPDPGRLVVHAVGEDGLPLPAPFDCGAPPGFARSDCVFDGVLGATIGVDLPAAHGYVAPRGFGWTLTSEHDEHTAQLPRATVVVEHLNTGARFCVSLTELTSEAADSVCSGPVGGHVQLFAMSAGTYVIEEIVSPPGTSVVEPVTVTLGNGDVRTVYLQQPSSTYFLPVENANAIAFRSPPGTTITATAVTPTNVPSGVSMPYGAFDFTVSGVAVGATVTVTIDLPLDELTTSYWKSVAGVWSQYPHATFSWASFMSRVTLTLTDGGAGDSDGIANGVIVDPGAPAIVAPTALRFSASSDRSGELALSGAVVSGKVAVFVPGTDDDVRSVRFSIDGKFVREDREAPFDLLGTQRNGSATMLSTRLLRDGQHKVTARIVLTDGAIDVRDATFVTSNPRPATRALMVSRFADRRGARALDGATVTGPLAVFLPAEPDMLLVAFHLDDTRLCGWPDAIEVAPPFDFAGTERNGQADTTRFKKGRHTLTARVLFDDGHVDVFTASFTVT